MDYQTEAYPRPGFEPPAYPENGSGRSSAGPSYPAQDYQTEAYPRPGSEAPAGFGEEAGTGPRAQDSFSPAGPGAYPQAGYGQDGYGQDGYGQTAYDQDGYGSAGLGPPGARQDSYPPDGYSPDAYVQPGFQPPGAPGYGDDDFASRGRPPRPAVRAVCRVRVSGRPVRSAGSGWPSTWPRLSSASW